MLKNRGFTILNTDDLSYEFINNQTSLKFIKLNYPDQFTKELIENNKIDVHIKYDENYNEQKIEEYLNQISKLNPAFYPQIVMETEELDQNIDISQLNFNSIPDLMSEYINMIDIANKREILNILIDLYNIKK